MREWAADSARDALSEIIDSAVGGTPQVIRRGDGRAVVVVSQVDYAKPKSNLKEYLLNSGYAPDDDDFDQILKQVREESRLFEPRPVDLDD